MQRVGGADIEKAIALRTKEAAMAESRFTTASDGLELHALDYGSPRALAPSPRLPVVCLPGLSRTAEDFTALATVLAKDRRVLALDLRGRGRSGYDRDPAKLQDRGGDR